MKNPSKKTLKEEVLDKYLINRFISAIRGFILDSRATFFDKEGNKWLATRYKAKNINTIINKISKILKNSLLFFIELIKYINNKTRKGGIINNAAWWLKKPNAITMGPKRTTGNFFPLSKEKIIRYIKIVSKKTAKLTELTEVEIIKNCGKKATKETLARQYRKLSLKRILADKYVK